MNGDLNSYLQGYYMRNGEEKMVSSSEFVASMDTSNMIQLTCEVNPKKQGAEEILKRFMELDEMKAVETDICERLGGILTKAILKDLYKRGKTDRLMELAVVPDSVNTMKKYITEGLKDSGMFRSKATATQMISDLNGLKLKAIGYITDRERQAQQAGRNAGVVRNVAPAERKPVMGRVM